MKTVITGGRGQLGEALARQLASTPGMDVVLAGREDLDICQATAVEEFLERKCPSCVINCAAYTNVDGAEDDVERAFQVNDLALGPLADATLRAGARLIHMSTDYVFSGDFGDSPPRGYTETDPPAPINVYGKSKLAGERRLLEHDPSALILRTSWLYGGRERNFLQSMLRLGQQSLASGSPLRIVSDQRGTPTDCWSLAIQIARLLEEDAAGLRGVVHASCEGETTWYGFAREIFEELGWAVPLEAIPSSEFRTRARRPQFSVLENARLKERGLLELPSWREGLVGALKLLSRSSGESASRPSE